MQQLKINVMVMSGSEDGTLLKYAASKGDGTLHEAHWTITIGRQEDSDIRLNGDTYISRDHARLHCISGQWWLEDCGSRNGTFITQPADFFRDTRVRSMLPLENGQLFRIGRTWLHLQP
ncbi:MAG: FHA domain-containing protein [Armatimonadetes bacterium]|nr:FHA domain-containing protein [Anaerolineae bacterium]